MALDSIVFWSTAAGNMAALAPTTAVIKGNSGDAYIVGWISGSTANSQFTVSCPGDPRWEAAGIQPMPNVNVVLSSVAQDLTVKWLPTKIPIRCGATLQVAALGAADTVFVVYVDYPSMGDAFKVRDPCLGQPTAFQVSKIFTAAGACTAVFAAPILVNTDADATFQRGRSYTPIRLEGSIIAGTTPPLIGIQNTKFNLATFWFCGNTPFLNGGAGSIDLPYGLGTVDGGETQFVHMASQTAEAPSVSLTYAYTA